MANPGSRGDSNHPLEGMFKKSPSSQTAAILTRGAYMEYVSTAKWRPACTKRVGEGRERSWRLFSTFPCEKNSEKSKLVFSLYKQHSLNIFWDLVINEIH